MEVLACLLRIYHKLDLYSPSSLTANDLTTNYTINKVPGSRAQRALLQIDAAWRLASVHSLDVWSQALLWSHPSIWMYYSPV